MADYEAKFEGMDTLIKRINSIKKMEEAQRIVKRHTARLAQLSTHAVPVRSGNLKRSLGTSIGAKGLSGTVYYTANYAPYVEFGTRWYVGRRFLGAPFLSEKIAFLNDIRRLAK